MPPDRTDPDRLIKAWRVRELLGNCSDMFLWRRLHDGSDFPQPIYIGRSRFWREADLLDWIAAQKVKTTAAARAETDETACSKAVTALYEVGSDDPEGTPAPTAAALRERARRLMEQAHELEHRLLIAAEAIDGVVAERKPQRLASARQEAKNCRDNTPRAGLGKNSWGQ